jgi:GMP synthase (glutamine-hydrolysing)
MREDCGVNGVKTCPVLRHVSFEDLGTIASIPSTARVPGARYVEVGLDELEPAQVEGADLLIVLGGPIGVREETYPFLSARSHDSSTASRPCGQPSAYVWARSSWREHLEQRLPRPGAKNWMGSVRPDGGRASGRCATSRPFHVFHWHGDNL